MRWAAVSSVTSAEIVTTPQPGADGLERIGVAGDDRHPDAVRDQGLGPRPRLPPVTTSFLSLRLITDE
jgi:hypothetical protein